MEIETIGRNILMENYCLNDFFRDQSQLIRIFVGKETETDPYEHTVEEVLQNPIPIRAIVTDLTPTQMQWKSAGIIVSKAKEIIIKKRYENLLKISRKIEIQSEFYYGWKTNGQLNYRIEGDFMRIYAYIKKES